MNDHLYQWFYRTKDEFSFWKRWTWRILGTKRIGREEILDEELGLIVTTVVAYTYREITLIWKMETTIANLHS